MCTVGRGVWVPQFGWWWAIHWLFSHSFFFHRRVMTLVLLTHLFICCISRIATSTSYGQVNTIAGTGVDGSANGIGTTASFYDPYGLCISPDASYLLIADNENNMLRQVVISRPAGRGQWCVWRSLVSLKIEGSSVGAKQSHCLSIKGGKLFRSLFNYL
jgi:hypothetical protein